MGHHLFQDQPQPSLHLQVDVQAQGLAQGQRIAASGATHTVRRPRPGVTAATAFFTAFIEVMLIHVVTVVLALLVGAAGIRQAERQEITGNGADHLVVPDFKGLPALLAADPAFQFQAIARIVRDRVCFGRGSACVVLAEVFAQGVAAHGPAEGLVEFGQVDGRSQCEIKQVCGRSVYCRKG